MTQHSCQSVRVSSSGSNVEQVSNSSEGRNLHPSTWLLGQTQILILLSQPMEMHFYLSISEILIDGAAVTIHKSSLIF